jgi:hypothetical protein
MRDMAAIGRPTQSQLRLAETATWGGKPPARRQMRLRGWKRVAKGSLIGFANITLPIGGADLEVEDIPVLTTNGKLWATWPGNCPIRS